MVFAKTICQIKIKMLLVFVKYVTNFRYVSTTKVYCITFCYTYYKF